MPRKTKTKTEPLPRFPSELMAARENAYHRDEYRRECWVREELEKNPEYVREAFEDSDLQYEFEDVVRERVASDLWEDHSAEVEKLEAQITKLQDALNAALEKCA